MKQGADYITEEKRKDLERKLAELRGPKRQEIIEALKYAKSLGDLSENAEYHQAREEQGKLEEKIFKIEQVLQSSQVVKGGGGDTIEIGSRISVEKKGTKERKNYTMVGSEESNMAQGKISNRSPLGQAIFGKKKGESITFKTPNGKMVNYKIISVS